MEKVSETCVADRARLICRAAAAVSIAGLIATTLRLGGGRRTPEYGGHWSDLDLNNDDEDFSVGRSAAK